ncbi:MAG: hypothetical protein E7638_03590 [Ruminococcaceae bacterium]|nr:hypothetical protein [Oscillospiraceae bacterium]
MSKIHVTGKMRSANEHYEEMFVRSYDEEGNLVETRSLSCEEDYPSGAFTRVSRDNGRTWGEWVTVFNDEEASERRGRVPGAPEGDEFLGSWSPEVVDPKNGYRISVGSFVYILRGHDVGYFDYWRKGDDTMRMKAYFRMVKPDGTEIKRMMEFEEGGADFDPDNPRNPAFIDKNRATAADVRLLPDGDIIFMVAPIMTLCCKMAGVDVNNFFPSCPNLQQGLMYARAHWNEEKEDYDITYSNPIMLSDLQSARGIMEPNLQILPNGKWLLVFRGAASQIPVWNTRTNSATPPFKWYTISEDGGRTFAPPMPWHFDTREVVYSPASISAIFRSKKNGRLYWIGNYLTQPWLVDESGSDPRWPLQICEINEEYGYLIKETLTEIDTRREGEGFFTELTNFNLLENRETLDLELRLTKICQRMERYEDYNWYSEAWEYNITFEE